MQEREKENVFVVCTANNTDKTVTEMIQNRRIAILFHVFIVADTISV